MAKPMTVEEFATACAEALGRRLEALLLYGSLASGTHVPGRSDVNTLLVCDAVDEALFAALEPVVARWRRAGHPAPLILTMEEWRGSADAFPIEYGDMREAHRLLAGRDPWAGITVRREDLRRQLEHELKGKLLRLRQAYAALRSEPKRLGEVIERSAPGFFTMVRAVLRLAGRAAPAGPGELVRAAAATIGFPAEAFEGLVAQARERRPLKLKLRDERVVAYLAAVARTAEFVHRLE